MSKAWTGAILLLTALAVTTAHAQPPVPESVYGPSKAPSKRGRQANLESLDAALPVENTLPLSGDGNAFCDTGFFRHDDDPFRFWIKGGVLFWHITPQNLATPLVTTVQPQSAIDLNNNFGAISQPNTVIIEGDRRFDFSPLRGGRVTGGAILGGFVPFEISGFWNNEDVTLLNVSTSGQPGSPLFARPVLQTNITNVQGLPQEGVFLIGGPDQSNNAPGFAGDMVINARTNYWGLETTAYFPIGASETLFLDLSLAYRYTELNEGLEMRNSISPVNPAFVIPFNADPFGFPVGFTTIVHDDFSTRNQFHGAQLGSRVVLGMRRLAIMVDGKVALGATRQQLNVFGNSTLVPPNADVRGVTTVDGGILAVASNSGQFERTRFTVIPEATAHAVVKITRNVRIIGSYSVMYWNGVVRPGDQLDSVVDTRQMPTSFLFDPDVNANEPRRRFIQKDFWTHGLFLGVWIGF